MNRIQENATTENYANPSTCFFHVLFKGGALAFYILSTLFANSFVIIFVITVLLAALDFWIVKNVSGRILVGLRWWNEINEQGVSIWKFECLDQESLSRMNKKDSWLFWWTIYLSAVAWVFLDTSNQANTIFHWRFSGGLDFKSRMATSLGKKLIQIDVSIDTVCPWCFVGRHNLQNAMDASKEKYDFEVRYHPFFLNTSAPKEGVKKSVYWMQKFGAKNSEQMESRMEQIFRSLGYEYDLNGLTGNSLDSHRLIQFAAKQGYDKQNLVVKELLLNYFIEGKYISDKQVLLDAAAKVGIEGASELLDDPINGVKEVDDDFRKYSANISGVPYFVINGERHLSGGQPPEAFQMAFESVSGSTN